MFGKYFNIDESAFSIAPDPKYLYLSKQHEEALAHLIYGVTRKGGFVCLTGDIGTGKTTICRCMFEQLPKNTDIAFVINPKFSPKELLASICDELHIEYSSFQPGIKEYVKKLNQYLISSHGKGRCTVLVIDEAQNLSVEALEHVRALTNLETNDQKLLQIILIGQPELKVLLAKPELEQVNQRITARFHIGPLNLNETNHYINHRLAIAGATKKIFSIANIKQIFRLSKGVPRRINILCDRILLGAYTIRKSKISSEIISQSAQEVFGETHAYSSVLPKALAASVAVLLISGLTLFTYQNYSLDKPILQSSLNILTEEKDQLASNFTSNSKEKDLLESGAKDDLASASNLETNTNVADKNLKVSDKVLDNKIYQANEVKSDLDVSDVQVKARDDTGKIKKLEVNKLDEKKASYTDKGVSNQEKEEAIKARSNDASKTNSNNIPKAKPEAMPGGMPGGMPEAMVDEMNELADVDAQQKSIKNQNSFKFTDYGKAYQQLFRLWAINYSSTDISPCEYAFKNQLHCFQGRGSIEKVIGFNRPVLLKSKADHYQPGYIVMVSIESDYAVVIEKGDYKLIPISEIEANWSGEFEILWRPLKPGITYIKPGQEGDAIALLDKKLANIQGRNSIDPLPEVYSDDLVDQVRAFQIANNLPSDGVVGPVTQIFFNNKSIDTPYLVNN